ncbi:MAG: PTS sugar transporter subunit IIA [Calditrichia bacterium]|nr:PTS sugar transporter subunit IIA [Calditrichia bacterium]
MSFFEILNNECIIIDLKSKDKYEVIEALLNNLNENGFLANKEQALQDVFEREQYLSTGLENGLAIPHAKSEGVESLVMSFGICREGVDFESLDGKPAKYIFLMLSPKDTSGPHLKALGQITRTFKSAELIKELEEEKSVEGIKAMLTKFNENFNPTAK